MSQAPPSQDRFAGEYGEPDIELVLRVLSPDSNGGSQGTA